MTIHFSLDELTIRTGVYGGLVASPELNAFVLFRLGLLAEKLEELRFHYGGPIYITSGFRDTVHNSRVGGVENSQHLLGNAADLTCSDVPKLARIAENMWRWGWVHHYIARNFIHVDIRNLFTSEKEAAGVDEEVEVVRSRRFPMLTV